MKNLINCPFDEMMIYSKNLEVPRNAYRFAPFAAINFPWLPELDEGLFFASRLVLLPSLRVGAKLRARFTGTTRMRWRS